MISTICETFGCLPSQAVREPYELIDRVVMARHYARTYQAVKHGRADAPPPTGPMADIVYRTMDEMEMDDLRDGIARWRARKNEHEAQILVKRLRAFRAAYRKKWGKESR